MESNPRPVSLCPEAGRDGIVNQIRLPARAGAAILFILTLCVYLPAVRGGFIWDDDRYVTENTAITGPNGLGRIWFELRATPQYYPLVFTTFWAEYRLWGDRPAGYHVVNVLLHATAACLLWRVLVRLRIPGAWLAGAIFAVHPVNVESVAWITERKNVLSGVLYLLTLLAYRRFERLASADRGTVVRNYLATLILFCCALLSKTVTCTLPATLLLLAGWRRRRVTSGDLLRMAPMFLLGLALGLVTLYLEKAHVRAEGQDWQLSPAGRCLVAGRAFWFYLGKLFWPHPLAFIYPHWEINTSDATQYVYPLGVAALAAALWAMRKRTGTGPLAAMLFFTLTLAPALGFFDVYPMRFSYVADHFQYLAGIGPIVLFAACAARLWKSAAPRAGGWAAAPVVPLLALLGVISFRQCLAYRDAPTLWRDTLAKNAGAWIAQNNLGLSEEAGGRLDQAARRYAEALRLKPSLVEGHNNLANVLVKLGRIEESLPCYERAISLRPEAPEPHCNLGLALSRLGRDEEAIKHLKAAIEFKPDFPEARFGLAFSLARRGRSSEAAEQYRIVLELRPNLADAHFNLAGLLEARGQLDGALEHYQAVARLNPGDREVQRNIESLQLRLGSK
jgi:Flp pilus assembly protein TadD